MEHEDKGARRLIAQETGRATSVHPDMPYRPLAFRIQRVCITSAQSIKESERLSRLSHQTRLSRRTLLLAGLTASTLFLIISPRLTVNLISILLPLSRTVAALDDGDHVVIREERKRWWDYWMLLCTAFLIERLGLNGLVSGYWGWKLVCVFWLCATSLEHTEERDPGTDEGLAKMRRTFTQDGSTQTCDPWDNLTYQVAEEEIFKSKVYFSPPSPSSTYSAKDDESPFLSPCRAPNTVRTSEHPVRIQPDRGVATTLDDLLELEFENYSEASHESESPLLPESFKVPGQGH